MEKVKSEIRKFEGQRLVAIVCIDEGRGITLNYVFDNNGKISEYTVRAQKGESIGSISDTYPSAEIYEREIHDFFGVEFEGNPHLHEGLFLSGLPGKPPLLREKGKKVK